ncbi:hypothetical protein DOY81_002197 [Sarcophaga bullata]|nr:hypothetical protein DOY81_002197 [Sarcophaga bullata]
MSSQKFAFFCVLLIVGTWGFTTADWLDDLNEGTSRLLSTVNENAGKVNNIAHSVREIGHIIRNRFLVAMSSQKFAFFCVLLIVGTWGFTTADWLDDLNEGTSRLLSTVNENAGKVNNIAHSSRLLSTVNENAGKVNNIAHSLNVKQFKTHNSLTKHLFKFIKFLYKTKQNPFKRNFNKVFVFLAVLLVAFMGQSEAGWLRKIGKKIERVGQHTRDATIQTIAVAQQAANVAATLKVAMSSQKFAFFCVLLIVGTWGFTTADWLDDLNEGTSRLLSTVNENAGKVNNIAHSVLFVFLAVLLVAFMGQSEAGWLRKIGKKIERVGQHTRDATIQTIAVAQQAANVAATLKG